MRRQRTRLRVRIAPVKGLRVRKPFGCGRFLQQQQSRGGVSGGARRARHEFNFMLRKGAGKPSGVTNDHIRS